MVFTPAKRIYTSDCCAAAITMKFNSDDDYYYVCDECHKKCSVLRELSDDWIESGGNADGRRPVSRF